METKVYLALGVHGHQPVGNFDFILEEACQKSYLPFLDVLEKHTKIRLALHYSGILWEWISDHRPELIDKVCLLAQRGQIEVLTGGLYEPILSILPDEEKRLQIRSLTELIVQMVGQRPRGMWLAERVWEPHLPQALAEAGVEYTLIDDAHFKYAGLSEEELMGYYLTEEQGTPLNIFPISQRLRYTIPFRSPQETIDYLREIAQRGEDKLVVFADDVEKFGIWPGTYRHCYHDGWLESFFSALEAECSWIEIVHFSQALSLFPPLGRIYLPTASYSEMMHWALPSQAFIRYEEFNNVLKDRGLDQDYGIFVRGGFWRNFLAKYPESNNMHKKMLRVGEKLRKISSLSRARKKLDRALNQLMRGQCNDAYWHGVFGGLYLNHLRFAIYRHLINAEKLADDLRYRDDENWIECHLIDFDRDGHQELLIETSVWNLYFSPTQGGMLFELDYKPKSVNVLDTLSRREEGYHKKLKELASSSTPQEGVESIHDVVMVKEKGWEKLLTYDWYRRVSLIDHFLGEDTTLASFSQCQYAEQGDFVAGPYQHEITKSQTEVSLHLFRNGRVWCQGVQYPIFLSKTVRITSGQSVMTMDYQIENRGNRPANLWFGVEFNLALLAGNAPDRYYHIRGNRLTDNRLKSVGEIGNVREFGATDEYLGIEIRFSLDRPATWWRFPIETISLSESGFERVYQSSVLFPNWRFILGSEDMWRVKISKEIAPWTM